MKLSIPIKQKDTLFETVLNTISDGVTVIDKDLRITFQNKTITQLYGSTMIGTHFQVRNTMICSSRFGTEFIICYLTN
jgi:hypothetical protein